MQRSSSRSRFEWIAVCIFVAVTVLAIVPGCDSGDKPVGYPPQLADNGPGGLESSTAGQKLAANEILNHMIVAYQDAESYRDKASAQLKIRDAQDGQEAVFHSAITFKRQSLLHWQRNGLVIASDGERLYGRPEGWDGQVVTATAPAKIQVPAFYHIESFAPLLAPTLEGQHPIQLDLLTADEPLNELLDGTLKPTLLDPQETDGRPCHRVGFQMDEGDLVLWIDVESYVLRRLDYPTDSFRREIAKENPSVEAVTLTAQFTDAELNPELSADTFKWISQPDEKLVQALVQMPDPRLKPSPLLGQTVESFAVIDPDGKKIESDEWKGKITVLDFWATWCGYCLEAMPKVDQVAKQFADAEDVVFLAVSTDQPDVENQAIIEALQRTSSEIPWVRVDYTSDDPDVLARFGADGIPLYVILGKEGRVQMLHVGGDITAEKLSAHINLLREGKDAFRESQKEWEALQQGYQQQLKLAQVGEGDAKVIELPMVDLAPASQPKHFTLSEQWQNSDLEMPGNITVVDDDTPNLLIIDQFRNVVRLGADGQIIERHDDIVPSGSVVTSLRRATGEDGRRLYLASATGQTRLYLFSEAWKLLLQYPDSDTAQIADAVLADLDGSGTPEIVIGYLGEVGVHAVSLSGDRLWRNRSLSHVADMTVTQPDRDGRREVVCTHALGTLVPIDYMGREQPPIVVTNRSVLNVAAADLDGDGETELCALAIGLGQQSTAVGVDMDGVQNWQFDLPPGFHETSIESITTAILGDDEPAYWLIAASDGTVHIVSADGKTIDYFGVGRKLSGLAATTIDGKPTILVAGGGTVTAWAVEKK